MRTTGPTLRRFTRAEYYRIAETGVFNGQRVELMDGEIVKMSPIGPRHAGSTGRLYKLFLLLEDRGFVVRGGQPLALGDTDEPEPDIAVVAGRLEDFDDAHPTTAALVVEVADSSLQYDRARKSGLYARAGIPEYWIIDLQRGLVELQTRAEAEPSAPFGHAYAHIRGVARPGESVAPGFAPDVAFAVSAMLPGSHKQ